jgi:hypothetical protein
MYRAGIYILSFLPQSNPMKPDSLNIDLSELEPLYEPDKIQFSFQTPGWYIVFGLIGIIILFAILKWIQNYTKNKYRREALKNLETIENHYNINNDSFYLNAVFVLLKVVAIQKFGRETVAQSFGDSWLKFLEAKGKDTPFQKHAAVVSAILYESGEVSSADAKQLFELTRKWIKTHA